MSPQNDGDWEEICTLQLFGRKKERKKTQVSIISDG
ncbi:hypothetical protein FHS14_004674 [Paenibacillus baekrokdamisoli]|nr:hypothetical protein [Paenibacillus baekrokdamisoli]